MASLPSRLASARGIADGRRILATDIERHLRTRYTLDTVRALKRLFPCVRFVWLMGADNLGQFTAWHRWMEIARAVPFAVLPRPTYTRSARASQAAFRLARYRLPGRQAPLLAGLPTACLGGIGRARERVIGNGPSPAEKPGGHRRRPIARKPAPPTGPAAHEPKRRTPKIPAVLKEAAKAPGTPRKKAVAAGPRGKREEPADQGMLERLQAVIVDSLEGDKAEAVVAIDLAGRASFADRMVIATGLADRQITAMATHLEDRLAAAGVKRVRVEGAGGSDWVLIDAGDIVIHLFKPDARSLYALEKMWGAEFDEPAAQSV